MPRRTRGDFTVMIFISVLYLSQSGASHFVEKNKKPIPMMTTASMTTKKPSGRKKDKSSPSPNARIVSPISFAAHFKLCMCTPPNIPVCYKYMQKKEEV